MAQVVTGLPNGDSPSSDLPRPLRNRKRKEVEVVDEVTDRAQKRMVRDNMDLSVCFDAF